jgi:SagB-type dehydrogenase family enzyme
MMDSKVIELPPPQTDGQTSIEHAIANRRSVRDFRPRALNLQQISQLLWAGQGITGAEGVKRAAPSAGATYPMDLYIVIGSGSSDEIKEGIYLYQPSKHQLKRIKSSDVRNKLSSAALNQKWINQAPVCMVITAVYERTTEKYRNRGKRYVHMEAGHIAENIYLQCESLELGTVVIGAFDDPEVQSVLGIEKIQNPLYIMPIGYPNK